MDPEPDLLRSYDPAVTRYMGSLQPRVEVEDCLFTHVEPWLDPHDPAQIWYYEGPPDSVQTVARSFAALPYRRMFFGHVHRWLAAIPR